MSQGQLGVLHTKSSYAPVMPGLPYGDAKVQLVVKLEYMIDQLRALEDERAHQYGCGSLAELVSELHKVFRDGLNDLKVLRNLNMQNLKSKMNAFRSKNKPTLENQTFIVQLTTTESPNLEGIFDSSGGGNGFTWTMHGNSKIHLKWNTSAVKSLANRLLKRKKFNEDSSNASALVSYITGQARGLINITTEEGQSFEEFIIRNRGEALNQTSSNIQKMLKRNPEVLQKVQKEFENYFYNTICSGASPTLMSAIKTVMGPRINHSINTNYFMKNNSWVNEFLSYFRECQSLILFQYIANKVSNRQLASKIIDILGRNFSLDSHYSDKEILEKFGFRVESLTGLDAAIDTVMTRTINIPLTKLGAIGGESIVDYVANACFNSSIPQISEGDIGEFIKGHINEFITDLDMMSSMPTPRVTFYAVGNSVIPGSNALQSAVNRIKLEVSGVSIDGDNEGDDSFFNEPSSLWHRPFHDWWLSNSYPPSPGDFSPTGQNSTSAWSGKVSIDATVTYNAMFSYRLF